MLLDEDFPEDLLLDFEDEDLSPIFITFVPDFALSLLAKVLLVVGCVDIKILH